MDVLAVLDTWRRVVTVDFLRYFLAAAPFYLVFWVWRPSWSRARRLQTSDPERARVLSEIAYSMSTVVIFSAVGLALLYANRAGLTRIYLSIPDRGWVYFGASFAIAVLIHDAYFYWSHRLLHWRPLFRFAHHVHHRSSSPTPWAAYAFHPIEALVQAGVYVLIVFTLPMHPLALGLFLVHMILRNVIGHLGFEIWPAGFARSPLTRWHLTPTHHDLHHRFGKGNYGFYFGLWDDWCGTSRTDYADAYDGVTAKRCSLRRPTAATIALLLGVGAFASAARPMHASEPSPVGRWSTIDDGTGEVRSLVSVRLHGDELRGRIERLMVRPGEDADPICDRCTGSRRGQKIVGMTILWGHRREGTSWVEGRVLDPANGKEYASKVWLDGDDTLRVSGTWGPFHRTQTWKRVVE